MAHDCIPDGGDDQMDSDDESRSNDRQSRSLPWSEATAGGCVIGDRGKTGILPRVAESVNCGAV